MYKIRAVAIILAACGVIMLLFKHHNSVYMIAIAVAIAIIAEVNIRIQNHFFKEMMKHSKIWRKR